MISSLQLREPNLRLNRPDSMRRKLRTVSTIFKMKKTDTCRRYYRLGKKPKRSRSWKMSVTWLWRGCGRGNGSQKYNGKCGQTKQSLNTRQGSRRDSSLRTVSTSGWSKKETKTVSSDSSVFKQRARSRTVNWHNGSNRLRVYVARKSRQFKLANSTVISRN